MPNDRIFGQIYTEIAGIKRQLEERVESVAYEHTGSGAPAHTASEGVLYWDYTNDDLYANTDGATAWQIIGGSSSAAAHNVLSATHLDSTASAVSRGAFVVGLGASPTWTRLDHPSAINRYIQSNAADPGWTANLPLDNGAWVGISATDLRVEFDSSLGYLELHLGDAAGSDRVRFMDSTDAQVAYVDSDGSAWFGGHVGIIDTPISSAALLVRDTALDTAEDFYGVQVSLTKTAGATDVDDYLYGLELNLAMDQAGGTIADMRGLQIYVDLSDGDLGDVVTSRSMRCMQMTGDLNGGKIWGDARGIHIYMDQEAANEVTDDVLGLFIEADADGTVGGEVILIKLNARSNVDWLIHADDTVPSFLGGDLKVGGTTAINAELHVDQESATGAQPVLLLDQGDASEQHIVCSIDGADQDFPAILQLDVTGSPTIGWIENDDSFFITHSTIINGTYLDTLMTAELTVLDGNIGVSNDGNPAILQMFAYGDDAGDIPAVRQRRALNTRASPSAVTQDDVLGRIGAAGYTGASFPTISTGYMQFEATENWDGASNGTRARFYVTATGATTQTLSLELTQNGIGYFPEGMRTTWSEANVSSPPTDAELDATFGTPAVVGEGFIALVDDNNANTAVYLVASVGGSWWYEALTKAT